uniref:SET domain-containing protein n=2 Tax=Moniliophthora roreri TaxID=221103 RepID=A0A0W0F565_MONRR
MPSSSPSPCHEDADPIETGRKEYATVWREFYSWEPQYCRDTMASLRAIELRHARPVLSPNQLTTCNNPFSSSPAAELCTITSLDSNGHIMDHETLFCAPAVLELPRRSIPIVPRYTFCTPLSRSIRHHNDDSERDVVPFIPYADDPQFSIIAYLRNFKHGLQWQKRNSPVNLNNPDLDMVEAEVARRLHFEAQLDYSSIDQMHLFFNRTCFNFCGSEDDFVHLRHKNKSGLIWLSNQRDHLNWPRVSQEELEDLSSNHIPDESTLFEDVNRGSLNFCSNLNCLHHFCTLHNFETPPFSHFKPRKTNDEIQLQEGNPCGILCFHSFLDTGINLECFHFSKDAATLISSVLDLDPDICPCDLSVICRMPCREVFAFRVQKFPNSAVAMTYIEDEEEGPSKADKSRLMAGHQQQLPAHVLMRAPVKTVQIVHVTSLIYFVNGTAAAGPNVFSASQANDVGIYNHLEYVGDPSIIYRGEKCQNVQIQRGMPQPIEIKDSQKYGWGAFATRKIAKNRLIGEYCGEILTNPEACQDGPIDSYRGLNYHFDLLGLGDRDGQTINSHFLGNETRYLNHTSKDDVFGDCNCEAIMRVVNGEPRLAIITSRTIKKGEELLFDYGRGYWETRT